MATEYAELRVYDPDGQTMRTALPVDGLTWSDEVGGGGGCSFTAYLDQPQLTANPALLDDCVVKVAVPLAAGAEPTEIAAYAVRNAEKLIVDRKPAVRVNGAPTLLTTWAGDAVVRPEFVGSGAMSGRGTERGFGWMSSSYNPADDAALWSDIAEPVRTFFPDNWPTGTGAQWITGSGGGNRKLYRGTLTISGSTTRLVRFYFSADDDSELWVGGEQVLTTQDYEMGWKKTYTVDRALAPGSYAVGIDNAVNVAVDMTGPSTTSDPVLFAAGLVGGDATITTWLLVSNDTTFVCARIDSDTVPPGPTPGAILAVLTDEAADRNVATWGGLTYDFDADEDSDGTPWPATVERIYRYGHDDYARVISTLADDGCDCRITPGLVLQARSFEGTNLSASVSLRPTRDIASWQEQRTPPLGSVADVETLTGWTTVSNAAALAAYGRREMAIPLGTVASIAQGRRIAAAALVEHGQPRWDGTVEFVAMPGAVPYQDFRPGDTVSLVPPTGSASARRVLSLSGSNGSPVRWSAELGEPNL
jgi:hypothetical protein